jgi:hypothetical protein
MKARKAVKARNKPGSVRTRLQALADSTGASLRTVAYWYYSGEFNFHLKRYIENKERRERRAGK